MAITAFSGPLIAFGQNPIEAENNPDLGSSLFYAGAGTLDPRQLYTYIPGEASSQLDYGWYGFDNINTVSIVPYTKATGAVVASANPTSATLALVSANSTTTGVYITPSITRADTGVVDTNGGAGFVTLDAYASVTASCANGVLTVTANTTMPIGPGMVILTAGTVTAGTLGTTTQVLSQLTGGSAGLGVAGTYQLNNTSLSFNSGTVTLAWQNPTQCIVPMGGIGTPSIAMWNPMAMSGRALAVFCATGATYTTATISSYDVYGFPVVESITLTPNSAVAGVKAHKYIKSVVLSGGTADTTHAYRVDTTDVFGLPIRSDTFGDLEVNYAASLTALTAITAATNYVASDRTVATATTGDVRGTFGAFTSSTGANKLVIRQTPAPYNVNSAVGLFGVGQYANF